MTYNPDVETYTVITTLLTNIIGGAILYYIFEKLRNITEIFYPRKRTERERTPNLPPDGFGKWISYIESISDSDTLGYIGTFLFIYSFHLFISFLYLFTNLFTYLLGLDAFMFLRFLRFCCKISVICAGIGMIILWPTYFTSNGHQDGVAGVNLYTIANVEPNGDRLYAAVICCWIFTLYFLYEIEEEYKVFVGLRKEYLLSDDPRLPLQEKYTVLVENLPITYQTPESLKELFETIFPNEIAAVSIACLTTELDEQIKIREEIITELEIALAYEKASPNNERKKIKINTKKNEATLLCGDEVDAIEFYTQKLMKANDTIRLIYESSLNSSRLSLGGSQINNISNNNNNNSATGYISENPIRSSTISDKSISMVSKDRIESKDNLNQTFGIPTNTGFVTFKSRSACLSAYRLGTLFDEHPEIKVSHAGSKSEMIWSNLHFSTKDMNEGNNIELFLFRIGLLFWGTILAFIAAISNLNNLEKYFPFLEQLDPTSYSILSGILPVAIMGYFISLLPIIFTYGAINFSKLKLLSQTQVSVFHWMYLYQIANVFVTTFSGSIFDSFVDILSNPTSIVSILGSSLPGVSVFFGNFTLSAALIGGATELLQIPSLLKYIIYVKILNQNYLTRRQVLNGPLAESVMSYGEYLPAILFIQFILLIYWVISPLTTLFCAIYFIIKYFILKYHFLYLYKIKFLMGGILFFELFYYSMLGLLISNITLFGYIIIKDGSFHLILLFPIFIVIYYKWNHILQTYQNLATDVPYISAVKVDKEMVESQNIRKFNSTYYKQPTLSIPVSIAPQEYRINEIPLFDENGILNDVYVGEIIEVNEEQSNNGKNVV